MSKGNSKNIPSINDVDSEVLEKTLFKDVLILRNKKTGILNIVDKVTSGNDYLKNKNIILTINEDSLINFTPPFYDKDNKLNDTCFDYSVVVAMGLLDFGEFKLWEKCNRPNEEIPYLSVLFSDKNFVIERREKQINVINFKDKESMQEYLVELVVEIQSTELLRSFV